MLKEKLATLEKQLKETEANYFRLQGAIQLTEALLQEEEEKKNKEIKKDAEDSKETTDG